MKRFVFNLAFNKLEITAPAGLNFCIPFISEISRVGKTESRQGNPIIFVIQQRPL